ncbi:sigma-70 family RNA polymerase sigma factor [Beijerinckia indica]|uniref:RNA polymerase, sigma-24 subunit, ECF subfamily n=1 Tax=Beijerinckia indica subsp. indica (strain ATCC 9039 / DSM 1715 / NCIMB 8712) TaxID=395963 RepID=B2IC97_BEII9|nr:sigma-70 family RNA polymerase sigma factor [Beijerinckia indica]ACB96694.1 RNA polymerase, sigma-24 subunit, ECF subfamily [Beijerinckia indica subsp. indica ATCC 9039]
MTSLEREEEWAEWMRLALAGDGVAYRRVLTAITPYLRATARNRLNRLGLGQQGFGANEAEDIVQEILLAVHLKRHTWDVERPIGPWLAAITRHKVVDSLRRRGYRTDVPIEDIAEFLPVETHGDSLDSHDVGRMLDRLNERQRDIVQSISMQGCSVRETAERLSMSEGAVRVALHRALKMLAVLFRSEPA